MKSAGQIEDEAVGPTDLTDADQLLPLVRGRSSNAAGSNYLSGVVIGELIGLKDGGRTSLVSYPGQAEPAAVEARTVVDLHGAHIGRQVVLVFDSADGAKPIILGVLRGSESWPIEERPGQVEVDADGERLILTANKRLVLRCGKASLTLTSTGKVLLEGNYVSSRSSGVNRIKGGSVQIN